MKKTYTTPKTETTLCLVEDFIAATNGGGTSEIGGEDRKETDSTEDGDQKAKQHSAWDTWDE